MTKVIRCDCGYVVQAGNDQELIRTAQEHAREAHAIDLTPEQILAMAEPA